MIYRALVTLALFTLSCDAATGGREVRYDLAVTSAGVTTFRTALGWDVTLREACVSLGPIYVYAGAPTARSTFYDWLVPSAHAHPGVDHFAGGEARGEWLSIAAVDALGTSPVPLGRLRGPAGPARTVSLFLTPPRSSTECLRGHQAYVAGVARRDGASIDFAGGLDIEDTGLRRRIQVPVEIEIDDGIALSVVVDPRPWLDEVRFDELDGEITPDSQARAAWFLGVQRERAFTVRAEVSSSH